MPLSIMPCIIFSGGKSSRMGENKSLLPFGGCDTLIEFQIKRLKLIFEKVYVSLKDKSTYQNFNAIVIEDIEYKEVVAPITGFINIFKNLKEENAFFVLSVDAPFVNEEIIFKLLSVPINDYDAVIIKTPSGIHPLCGIYTRSLENKIKLMIDNSQYKLKNILNDVNVYYIEVEDEDLLLNLNTPQEYQKALSLFNS